MDEDEEGTFKYRWISGIRGHMHVITGGVDMHVAYDDKRVVPESIEHPNPDNGLRGFVALTEALPEREATRGLYAVSTMTPFDEFFVVDYYGQYCGGLNRGRDGLYAIFPHKIKSDPRNQRYQTIPEALEALSKIISGNGEEE